MNNTNYEDLQNTTVSTLLAIPLPEMQIFSSASYSQISSMYDPLVGRRTSTVSALNNR
jgi:hypothetical protein